MVTSRRPRSKPQDNLLGVWSNGERMGSWSLAGGEHRFQYATGWIASPAGRPLSLCLPFTPDNLAHRGEVVRNFFAHLLPDSEVIRRRLQGRFATGSTHAFDLLAAVGRDCGGAAQLLPHGMAPQGFDRIDAVPPDEAGVEHAIDTAVTGARMPGLLEPDDFRVSIAGAQEKTALLWHEGQWMRPLGATPTTHIFKLPLGLVGNRQADMRSSAENEWLCAQLLQALGLPVAECGIARFDERKVLVVKRFDRALQLPEGRAPWLAQLPQEDFCQVLGISGTLKYGSDGGPGMGAMLRQRDTSSQAEPDKRRFVLAQLAFWLMAATDGHAKNFSIFRARGGGFRMTPLYDVLSIWPIIGNGASLASPRRAKLAMALRSKKAHCHLHEIHTRHWKGLARQSGVPGAFNEMAALVGRVLEALARLQAQLPAGFAAQVFEAIQAGMLAQADQFLAELA